MSRIPTWLVIAAVVTWIAAPILFTRSFKGGTDDQAKALVAEVSPGYRPWFTPLWAPNPDTETLLFAVQTGIGSAVLGYYFGLKRGRRQITAPPVVPEPEAHEHVSD
ncbi:MAG: cobalt transport protein CbiN [Chloroflexi bacterium]|nr:cobalt transport protein CbiN [Chloroflexota bacterium]MCL5274577.1 cobalt transport protein CbiN [Chloroflexota bacterium]